MCSIMNGIGSILYIQFKYNYNQKKTRASLHNRKQHIYINAAAAEDIFIWFTIFSDDAKEHNDSLFSSNKIENNLLNRAM